jgi:hypothetical protein
MSEEIKQDVEAEFTLVSEETPALAEEIAIEPMPEPVLEPVPELPKLSDIALAISLYLQDKQELLDSGDNWNPALVEAGDQSGWRFKNIPCPSLEELQALLQAQEPSQE